MASASIDRATSSLRTGPQEAWSSEHQSGRRASPGRPTSRLSTGRLICPLSIFAPYNRHILLGRNRPWETAVLEPLGEETETATVPEKDLDHVAPSAAEHEHVS